MYELTTPVGWRRGDGGGRVIRSQSSVFTHQLQVERRERTIEQYQVYADHHTPATGGRGEREREHRANQVYVLTTQQLQVERRERHRANQVYALTTHQLQVERRGDIEPIKCMRSPHTSYRWRGERVIEPIKCMRSHTPATGGEERESHRANQVYGSPHTSYRWRGESHRANQVYALTTHQLQVERRES